MSQLKTRLFKPEYSILLIILAFGCVVQAVSGQFFTMNTLVSLWPLHDAAADFRGGRMLALICVGPGRVLSRSRLPERVRDRQLLQKHPL